MINQGKGDLLGADVDALVNTVNTVGVMGKGIALQFKRAYPVMFKDYQRAAKQGRLELGRVHVWETGALDGPRYIINFPTKGHWRSVSKLRDIESGLADLVRVVKELGVRSVAVPPLGCGHGGLRWSDVEPRIRAAFAGVPDIDVQLFPPGETPMAQAMTSAGDLPNMTPGRAALVGLLSRYGRIAMDTSLVEVQKLLYFLQEAGEPLRLRYVQGLYGPYSDNLRHHMIGVEGHLLSGYGDGSSPVLDAEPIRVLPGAAAAADNALTPDTIARMDRVIQLAEGFESMYGMELLASVHWVARSGADAAESADQVRQWTPRKAQLFTTPHVEIAWGALYRHGWLPQAANA